MGSAYEGVAVVMLRTKVLVEVFSTSSMIDTDCMINSMAGLRYVFAVLG